MVETKRRLASAFQEFSHGFRRTLSRLRNQPHVFVFRDFAWDRTAKFIRGCVSPQIGKIAALLRFYGLNGATVADEKHARAIGFLLQGESTSVVGEPSEALDEIVLGQLVERGERSDLVVSQSHLTRPATAGRAALAVVKDWHGTKNHEWALMDTNQARRVNNLRCFFFLPTAKEWGEDRGGHGDKTSLTLG